MHSHILLYSTVVLVLTRTQDALLRILWKAIDYKFNKAKQNITSHIQAFDQKRQLLVDTEIVQGTREIQAALPVIQIQLVKPGHSYDVPYTRNPFFCGRDDTLRVLHDHLTGKQDPEETQRTCVIHGLGGVGKTQVAIEYTFRYRSAYQFIFWARAETAPELRASVERIAHNLNLANGVNPIDSFRKWLEHTGESRDGSQIKPHGHRADDVSMKVLFGT